MDANSLYQQVNDHYGNAAKASKDGRYGQAVAQAFGYSLEDLTSIPEDANLGLSCGNPLALAKLRDGETVIDLGSGAGFDVFLAARDLGPNGKAIGVDMNKDMLSQANINKEKANATNVTFIESRITAIDLPDSTADCIISNCVINLVPEPEKQLVFNEMYRLLKPGGRVAVSDILTKKELSQDLKNDMALYVGCISGASQVGQYELYLRAAGFRDILIVDAGNDLNVYTQTMDDGTSTGAGCCGSQPVKEKSASCCGTKLVQEKPASCCGSKSVPEKPVSCCGSQSVQKQTPSCCGSQQAQAKKSSCGGTTNDKSAEPSLSQKQPGLDLNTLAGSYKIFAIKS